MWASLPPLRFPRGFKCVPLSLVCADWGGNNTELTDNTPDCELNYAPKAGVTLLSFSLDGGEWKMKARETGSSLCTHERALPVAAKYHSILPAGLDFGFPFCHTAPDGGADAAPYLRATNIGQNLPDPDLNVREAAMRCNGKRPDTCLAAQLVATSNRR